MWGDPQARHLEPPWSPAGRGGPCASVPSVPSVPGRVPEGQMFSWTRLSTLGRPVCRPSRPPRLVQGPLSDAAPSLQTILSVSASVCLSLPHGELERHIGRPWAAASMLTRLRLPVWAAVLLGLGLGLSRGGLLPSPC